MEMNQYKLADELDRIFDYLHKHPEVSWEETGTSTYIQSLVSRFDCKVKTYDDCAGIVVDIGKGAPVVALRADMDALWQEVHGTFQANHSCGHDAHMTIALGVFLTMMENGISETGTFRFIFQPAEEKGTGALKMVEKGVVDDVDFLYGMHLRPAEELANGQFAPAIQHGAARFIKGTIQGEDAHGARPHLNANAIQVGSEFFQHLNNIQVDPRIPYSVKMTAFEAGGNSSNIIPGSATFSLDLRAQNNDVMQQVNDRVDKIASMLGDYHQVAIHLETNADVAAAVLDDDARGMMEEAIMQQAGEAGTAPMITTTGGDDFHFYTLKRPSLKATMLAIGCDLRPGLHHPEMTFDRRMIPAAVSILTDVLTRTAKMYNRGEE
ncbi:amidohydrolase AmhX [Lentibacillus kapialis]|uniref:Amidohydrolase AmhX n=1 Tax=Lentibacillus kapialis TaxID=340214 RepID=A0A917PX92_9BACI|nr:amidohydrolase [Lentibacillus kapialis]GGJ97067.1 amidohydrolase AmhX [Lentibacillus kapialis]